MTSSSLHAASERVRQMLRSQQTFQISVDVDNLPQGLSVAAAAAEPSDFKHDEISGPTLDFEQKIRDQQKPIGR